MPSCHTGLDRLAVIGDGISDAEILEIPGTRRGKKHLIRRKPDKFLAYGRKTEFTTSGTIGQIVVLSEPQLPHCGMQNNAPRSRSYRNAARGRVERSGATSGRQTCFSRVGI